MSYQEKKTLTSMAAGLTLIVVYALTSWGRYRVGAAPLENGALWAGMMLRFIGIGVVMTIVLQVLFHILLSVGIAVRQKIRDEACDDREIEKTIQLEMVEDERDKLIELKSLRAGFIAAGIGFVAALGTMALGYPPAVMLNVLFLSFFAGSLLEGFFQLYYYRRGL